tara:strand:- start:3233 stop:3547 length:315 start_codon:yes stop_codon:yes gene_type:complete
MTTMDPTLKELFISEVADVLAQLEDVIEKYQVNERVAYLFGLGIVDDIPEIGPAWQVASKWHVDSPEELAELFTAIMASYEKVSEDDDIDIDDIDLGDLGFNLN